MSNCKICGRPAKAALVVHLDCLEELADHICNYKCKMAMVCMDHERLLEVHCSACPLGKLMEMGGAQS